MGGRAAPPPLTQSGARAGTALKHSHKNTQTNLARYSLMAVFRGSGAAREGHGTHCEGAPHLPPPLKLPDLIWPFSKRDTYIRAAVFRHFTLPSIFPGTLSEIRSCQILQPGTECFTYFPRICFCSVPYAICISALDQLCSHPM